MKTYIDKNEIAALFFLHYFKYTRYAFKKHKSEEDIAAIHAHRELMRLFGRWHRQEGRVAAKTLIAAITSQVSSSANPFVQTVASVMKEAIAFIYDNVLVEDKEHCLLERYA